MLRPSRARWIPAALLGGHLPDDEPPVLDLLTDKLQLILAFLLGAFPCGLHETAPRFGFGIAHLPSPARSRSFGEIRCVGQLNLTSDKRRPIPTVAPAAVVIVNTDAQASDRSKSRVEHWSRACVLPREPGIPRGGELERRPHMNGDRGERYRRAAEDALQQLDWCIGYLHGIRKTPISRQLAKNRNYIRRNLMRQASEPLPTEVTTKT
jgi:hypothetical protein